MKDINIDELDKQICHHTISFEDYDFFNQSFFQNILNHDVIALGEIHGIHESRNLINSILKLLNSKKITLLILLERGATDSNIIQNFIDGKITELPSSFFPNTPKV